jgi:hypothetical protein
MPTRSRFLPVAVALAVALVAVPVSVQPASAVVPGGGDADAFARLQARLDAAPGVPWSVERDLVVPALPDIDHILDALAPQSAVGAGSERYPSLAAALIGVEASRSGGLMSQFVGANLDGVSDLTGLDPFALSRLDTSSVFAFDAGLSAAGGGFSFGSLDDLMARLGGPVSGVDQTVAASASSFARQLWQLNLPQMPSAPMPQVDLAAAGFGLLTNRSLSAFATDFPDVFATVSATGLGTEAQQQAWSMSMMRAYQSSQRDLNAALPSSCMAGMLAIAASGQPSSGTPFGTCGADCQAAGMYLNAQMLGLWQPSAFSNQPVDDGVLNTSELSRLPGWLRDGITADVAPATTSSTLRGSLQGTCATADPAAGAVGRVLPGVFEQLGR